MHAELLKVLPTTNTSTADCSFYRCAVPHKESVVTQDEEEEELDEMAEAEDLEEAEEAANRRMDMTSKSHACHSCSVLTVSK